MPLLASGLAVGVAAILVCVVHRSRSDACVADYAWGAGAWCIAVVALGVLEAMVYYALLPVWGEGISVEPGTVVGGLLSGVAECGGTWLVVRKSAWRSKPWSSTVAFGLGFGCFEALALAALVVAGTVLPGTEPLPVDPWRPFTFAFERVIVVPVHLTASVLILASVQRGRAGLFWWGFALKALINAVPVDGEIPGWVLNALYGTFGVVWRGGIPEWVLGVVYGTFGIFSVVAFVAFRRRQRRAEGRPPESRIRNPAS